MDRPGRWPIASAQLGALVAREDGCPVCDFRISVRSSSLGIRRRALTPPALWDTPRCSRRPRAAGSRSSRRVARRDGSSRVASLSRARWTGRVTNCATNPAATTAPSTPKRASPRLASRGRNGAPRSERRSHAPRSPPERGRLRRSPSPTPAWGRARLSRLATRARIEELLARTHAADASRIADVGFFPAAVGIPRTGWFVGSWIAGNAAGIQKQFAEIHTKFLANWVAYCTIPVVAGLLNWMTNSLAVKMIFSPEEYVGLEFRRWPETPAGLFGWQGIVPCKVRKMSTTMVELMTSRLLDVREVFGRLDKKKCGHLLEPGIDEIAAGVAEDLLSPGGALEGWRRSVGCVPLAATWAARDLARRHGKALVAEVLGEMQTRVPEVWDVKEQVVGAMCRDKGIIVELFQRCGRDEFIFIRRSGLYFGFLFGIFQMVQWLVWDPWWSLAVGGAAVGYATNWLALTLMFSPVNPIEFGPFTLHGAFLRRQAEVSVEFAEMLRDRVLTAELIWREILTSERTKGVFAEILERKTREQIRKARAEGGMVALAAGVLGEKAWRAAEDAAATRVLAELPSHLPLVYAYSDEALDLENTLREKMQGLSGEEFEGVLHPVFQEDELTLILVGAFLGLVAGFGQAAFF